MRIAPLPLVSLVIFLALSPAPATLTAQTAAGGDPTLARIRSELLDQQVDYAEGMMLPFMIDLREDLLRSIDQGDRQQFLEFGRRWKESAERIRDLSADIALAAGKADYTGMALAHAYLAGTFEERRKVRSAVQDLFTRNQRPIDAAAARLDSAIIVWQGGTLRVFTTWFEQNKSVIDPAMESPARDELGRFMLGGRNFRTDQAGPDAIVFFLLWDGEPYFEQMRAQKSFEFDTPYCMGVDPVWLVPLKNNTPDPFTASTTVSFSLPLEMRTVITVFDEKGKTVASPMDSVLAAGPHQLTLQTRNWKPGTYHVLLRSGTVVDAIAIKRNK